MKKVIIFLAVLLFLAGCSKKEAIPVTSDTSNVGDDNSINVNEEANSTEVTGELAEGYKFVYNDVTIPMNTDSEPIIESLGEPVEYFEAPSCAFQGLDKIYYYNGFELSTYPSGDKDIVSTVNFLDDSVTTEQGIYLGATLEEVIAAYGKDYVQDLASYTYYLGETKLTLIVEEDAVISITYFAVVEGLNN
ncbi:MAG: putative periplasmic lipoprotein [Mobilitalea sp.]